MHMRVLVYMRLLSLGIDFFGEPPEFLYKKYDATDSGEIKFQSYLVYCNHLKKLLYIIHLILM